ncbi:hypothetical protein B5S33_g5331 [[Candida] boidinii]|nr:hypothetical protein B5S30_g2079 [[Candida] boidinii]OWB86626.1 hypothetical protein B5S33_g5331 [[Candida] boidinii]
MEDPPDPKSLTHSFTYSPIQSFNIMSQHEFSEPVNDAANSAATTTASANAPSNTISTIKTVSTYLVHLASFAYFILSEQNIIV